MADSGRVVERKMGRKPFSCYRGGSPQPGMIIIWNPSRDAALSFLISACVWIPGNTQQLRHRERKRRKTYYFPSYIFILGYLVIMYAWERWGQAKADKQKPSGHSHGSSQEPHCVGLGVREEPEEGTEAAEGWVGRWGEYVSCPVQVARSKIHTHTPHESEIGRSSLGLDSSSIFSAK